MDASTTDVSALPRSRSAAVADVRYRWRMGPEAQGLVVVSAVLIAFGLAVLYSASAMEAMMTKHGDGAFFLMRQLTGVGVGVVVFAVAAKIDAERLRGLAWPLMGFTLMTMLLVLILPNSIAPEIHGSKRFLFATSFQPSEFAKLAVIVWVSMLIVKKGDTLRRFSKGLVPFLIVIGVLDVLAVLEPDVSVAMLFTLVMAILLYVGGARMAHFVFLGALAIPVAFARFPRLEYIALRVASFMNPSSAPAAIGDQLKHSLVAVGSGELLGRGFGQGLQHFVFSVQRLHRQQHRRGVGVRGHCGSHDRVRDLWRARVPDRAPGSRNAFTVSPARGAGPDLYDGADGVSSHRRGHRTAPGDRTHAAIHLVRPLEPGVDDALYRNSREHRQHERARCREPRDQSALRPHVRGA